MFTHHKGQLNFSGSEFPSLLLNPNPTASLTDSTEWLLTKLPEIRIELAQSGAILFRNFPIASAEDFDTFSNTFNYPNFTYQESLSNAVRINYTKRVFTANEAPKEVEIYLHHEMAQTPRSPQKLFFFCQSAAETGGATPLCRSDHLFMELAKQAPELSKQFEQKGIKYTTHMPATNDAQSGQGRSWRNTLSVENKNQAEIKLSELGYSWDWLAKDELKATTPTLSAVIEHHGDKVFYNQILAAYLGWYGVKENPDKSLCFGDGSSIPTEALDLITELSQHFTYDLNWQDGDMALIDNRRTMHGRRPYAGTRKRIVLVALSA